MKPECVSSTYPNRENKSKKAHNKMHILDIFIYLFIHLII